MKEVTLFEIPIYSMEEKEFNRRWDKEIKKYIYTNEQYNQIRNTFFPKNLWKYNQIIGYIVINLLKYDYGIDINFEWYQSDKKLYRYSLCDNLSYRGDIMSHDSDKLTQLKARAER